MSQLALAVLLMIPPMVAMWPAVLGGRFLVVAGAAALAATVVWSVALYVIPTPSDDTGPLPLILLPFYALIHTVITLVIVGIPWVIFAQRRAAD